MRKNIQKVISAFNQRVACNEKTCRTDGFVILSYELKIAERGPNGVRVLDPKGETRTTTGQIRAVLACFPDAEIVTSF